MAKIEFNVDPHWKFMSENYDTKNSFAFFGPYSGALITPEQLDDYTIKTTMPLEPVNTNYVGTHFGGSLYSMCDPFFMFLLIRHLGPNYIVWDKGAKIDFIKPGTGTVFAIFHIPEKEIEDIKKDVKKNRKTIRYYTCFVKNEKQEKVASVEKELYIRRKPGN